MDIDIRITCDCGEELDILDKVTKYSVNGVEMFVSPCASCAETNYDKGLAEAEGE